MKSMKIIQEKFITQNLYFIDMEELQEKYENLLEDYDYLLNLIKEKNEEVSRLELVIDNLLEENSKLKRNAR